MIPLTVDTSGGDVGRTISPVSRYMTTDLLIFMFMCCFDHWSVEKVSHKWWATSSAERPRVSVYVIRPEGLRTLMTVRSRVTLVLVMSPSPSVPWLLAVVRTSVLYPHHLDKFFILDGTFRPKEEIFFRFEVCSLSVSSRTRWRSSTSIVWITFGASGGAFLALTSQRLQIERIRHDDPEVVWGDPGSMRDPCFLDHYDDEGMCLVMLCLCVSPTLSGWNCSRNYS